MRYCATLLRGRHLDSCTIDGLNAKDCKPRALLSDGGDCKRYVAQSRAKLNNRLASARGDVEIRLFSMSLGIPRILDDSQLVCNGGLDVGRAGFSLSNVKSF